MSRSNNNRFSGKDPEDLFLGLLSSESSNNFRQEDSRLNEQFGRETHYVNNIPYEVDTYTYTCKVYQNGRKGKEKGLKGSFIEGRLNGPKCLRILPNGDWFVGRFVLEPFNNIWDNCGIDFV